MFKRFLAVILTIGIVMTPLLIAQNSEEVICLTRTQLAQVITDAVNEAVTKAVAAAVREKEQRIIDLEAQLKLKDLEIATLKDANLILVGQVTSDAVTIEQLKNERAYWGIGAGIGGTLVGLGTGWLIFGVK